MVSNNNEFNEFKKQFKLNIRKRKKHNYILMISALTCYLISGFFINKSLQEDKVYWLKIDEERKAEVNKKRQDAIDDVLNRIKEGYGYILKPDFKYEIKEPAPFLIKIQIRFDQYQYVRSDGSVGKFRYLSEVSEQESQGSFRLHQKRIRDNYAGSENDCIEYSIE
jgi:hypothetical protein